MFPGIHLHRDVYTWSKFIPHLCTENSLLNSTEAGPKEASVNAGYHNYLGGTRSGLRTLAFLPDEPGLES